MSDQQTPLDTRLARTLGSASLSPEQRRRHLDRIARHGSRRGLTLGRLLRDGAVVVVLIALMAGAWMMLPLGDSNDVDPMTAIAAMKEEISEPEPGMARYLEIEGEGMMPGAPDGLEKFTVRAWERWTDDGSAERAIHTYSSAGELIGRVIVSDNRAIFEVPGNQYETGPSLDMHPPELFQPIAAVRASEPGRLVEELEEVLEDEDVVVESEGGGTFRVSMPHPEAPTGEMLTIYEEQFGVQATLWGVEHLIDTESNQRLEWRVYVEDDEGERHTLQRYTFDGWHEIDESEIPEDAFAERTELSH